MYYVMECSICSLVRLVAVLNLLFEMNPFTTEPAWHAIRRRLVPIQHRIFFTRRLLHTAAHCQCVVCVQSVHLQARPLPTNVTSKPSVSVSFSFTTSICKPSLEEDTYRTVVCTAESNMRDCSNISA
jgi:hypothetical protein